MHGIDPSGEEESASLRNCILFHISVTLISFTGIYEPTIDLLPLSVAS